MTSKSGQSVDYSVRGNSVDNIAALTKMPGYQLTSGVNATEAAAVVTSPEPRPKNLLGFLVGAIVVLIILKFLSEHQKAGLELHHVRISVWNWVFITLMAATGLVAFKAVANKYWPQSAGAKFLNAA